MHLDLLVIVLGLCIGSFLNVCIYRIPLKQSVVKGSSYCPVCRNKIKPWDLIPILSYVFIRGRCRHCASGISPRYPAVELAAALLFYASYRVWGWDWQTLLMGVFLSMLVVVTMIDVDHQIVPDGVLLASLILGLPLKYLAAPDRFAGGIAGFLAGGLIMLAIAMLARGGMGGGDVKLSAVMGLFLGWPGVLVALFASFVTGGLYGVMLLAAGRKKRKDAVPFGPFLALGGVVSAFASDRLINWYLNSFF